MQTQDLRSGAVQLTFEAPIAHDLVRESFLQPALVEHVLVALPPGLPAADIGAIALSRQLGQRIDGGVAQALIRAGQLIDECPGRGLLAAAAQRGQRQLPGAGIGTSVLGQGTQTLDHVRIGQQGERVGRVLAHRQAITRQGQQQFLIEPAIAAQAQGRRQGQEYVGSVGLFQSLAYHLLDLGRAVEDEQQGGLVLITGMLPVVEHLAQPGRVGGHRAKHLIEVGRPQDSQSQQHGS